MKKFIIKCILGLMPILLWYIYMVEGAFSFMDEEFPYWMQQKDYISRTDNYNEMIILGDSTSKSSFRPNLISNHSIVNLSLGGASSVEMYFTLQTYLENHEAPKVAVFVAGPFHYVKQDCYISRNTYFHYFGHDEIREVRRIASQFDDPFWNVKGIDDTIRKYYFYDPQIYLPAVYNAAFTGRKKFNLEQYKRVEDEMGWMCFGVAEGNSDLHYLTTYEHFDVNILINYYVHQIIELCNKNDIRLIIEQAPINQSSLDHVKSNVQAEFRAYFKSLAAEYPNIIVNDCYMGYDDACFGDAKHLNEKGTEIYTNYIISKYGYLLN